MGWFIALGVLVALAILPIGITARYDADGPVAALIAGPVRVRLYPTKPKEKKKKPKKSKQTNKPAKGKGKSASQHPENRGGSWTDFLPLVRVILDLLGSFRRKLRVKRLELKVVMAGSDPCDLAVNYGKAWATLGNLMPQLERVFVIRKRNLEVECDFTADQTLVTARLDLTITVGRVLSMGLWHGVRALYHFFKIINKRKGGAE